MQRPTRTMGSLLRFGFTVAAMLLVAACGVSPPLRHMAEPRVAAIASGSTTLTVLTYNVEGLGWPARSGRAAHLKEIGVRLKAMRDAGHAPDVVLFQEVFSGAAKRAILATGYPAIVSGPHRTMKAQPSVTMPLPGITRWKHGELGIHLTGGGIVIASRYPIVGDARQPYGRRSCAGIDCLANKGVMLARIAIPGVPVPIDIYNTHMNSRGASKAPEPRNLAAHERQAFEASQFVKQTHVDANPMIFGGDFNMRHSEPRWDNLSRYQSLHLVHRVCADPQSGCDVRMSWDGDEPWMDTQDLQFFANGQRATVRPIRVEAMFDGGSSGPELSDHDGFLVTYRIDW
ncbi:endonuclease/exonuclease/phosphatase family protein [Sphingomonas crocodyli]|nr:endonuclease/exonuclease/phosphatase family protein [Sphingomonas crocodyli]